MLSKKEKLAGTGRRHIVLSPSTLYQYLFLDIFLLFCFCFFSLSLLYVIVTAKKRSFIFFVYQKITIYIEKYLSPFLCGFRKGFNTQHALMALIEKWKQSLDEKGYAGGILMDLSKAFDTINHQLLIAKLHAYGFDKSSLTLILSYLSNRWQRTKINLSFSSWSELLQGVPQGSVL